MTMKWISFPNWQGYIRSLNCPVIKSIGWKRLKYLKSATNAQQFGYHNIFDFNVIKYEQYLITEYVNTNVIAHDVYDFNRNIVLWLIRCNDNVRYTMDCRIHCCLTWQVDTRERERERDKNIIILDNKLHKDQHNPDTKIYN